MPTAHASKNKLVKILLAAFATAILLVWVGKRFAEIMQPPTPVLLSGSYLDPAMAIPAFSLVDHNGQPFDNRSLLGHWSVLFFGFTNCPGPCPDTLSVLDVFAKSLANLPSRERPHVVFISLDAKRDSPQVMQAYVQHFNPTFIGVTGEQAALDSLALALGLPSKVIPMDGGNYMIDHALTLLLVNPQGQVRAIFSPPHVPRALAVDYCRLARCSM